MESECKLKASYINYLFNYNRLATIPEKAYDYLDFFAENNQWKYYYVCYQTLLESYYLQGEHEKALDEANKLYRMAEERNHLDGKSSAAFIIGLVLQELDQIE